ncbi:hypothetical protein NDU88_002650 [Pleurodeles waltl]|uniref:Uncharacterized protein n=1 Tax=Pleurodeles waltl TaxID=8319 RepID=A0AAV7PBH6_PLEWA|nr:hypothetical protein NDU88_002650 [Pleurodeles waltl]
MQHASVCILWVVLITFWFSAFLAVTLLLSNRDHAINADTKAPLCSQRTAQERTGAAAGEDGDKNWLSEIEKVEYDGRNGDWLKDGEDIFYSLTEASEAASSRYDLNEEGGRGSSEAESLAEIVSPIAGPTVRLQRQHHKRTKSITGSVGVTDSPAATLMWDYSGIRLPEFRPLVIWL